MFNKCSVTNFSHNRRDLQIIAFSGNSSLNSLNISEPLNWISHYWITLLNLKTAIYSYITSVKTRISHTVAFMQVQKKHLRSWLGGGVRPGWRGVRSNQSNPPWLRAWTRYIPSVHIYRVFVIFFVWTNFNSFLVFIQRSAVKKSQNLEIIKPAGRDESLMTDDTKVMKIWCKKS